MEPLKVIAGGITVAPEDVATINLNKSMTKRINDSYIQVGAVFIRPLGKNPTDSKWFKSQIKDTDLQSWIDNPEFARMNVGFNLQRGWLDLDIDIADLRNQPLDVVKDAASSYATLIRAGLHAAGVDTRFAFGRRSLGVPTHLLVQLPLDEVYDALVPFEPRHILVDGLKLKVQIRSNKGNGDKEEGSQQTVMPGSLYGPKFATQVYDPSIWYAPGRPVRSLDDLPKTTHNYSQFRDILRGIAYGTIAYLIKDHWVPGSRQDTARVLTGWLARQVALAMGINADEALSSGVMCPISTDAEAEGLIDFLCETFRDDEAYSRKRVYRDARGKLERNPDAKVPGWPAMIDLLGMERVDALHVVLEPGVINISPLTEMAETYVFDEDEGNYIDRKRHFAYDRFVHDGASIERRHKGDKVKLGGKSREVFKLFESSALRVRVGTKGLYPDLAPGGIHRIDTNGAEVSDDYTGRAARIFNTWTGWPILPSVDVDPQIMERCNRLLDQLLGYLTRSNDKQCLWIKRWLAWTLKHPGIKQQIALVIVGGQGIGKSFFGGLFLKKLFSATHHGTASPATLEGRFTIEPFLGKLITFIDEARFKGGDSAADEIKKIIRNVDVPGAEKFASARTHKIYSRVVFASNHLDINVSERDELDRALFFVRTVDHESMNMTRDEFRLWAITLKPFFDEFGTFLEDEVHIRHFLRLFHDIDVTKRQIEDVTVSSTFDAAVVEHTLSWPRRLVRSILASGWIIDETLIFETPYTTAELDARITREAQALNMRSVNTGAVKREMTEMGLSEAYSEDFEGAIARFLRPQWRWGECCERFAAATKATIDPYREFVRPKDYGVNETMRSPPVKRLGAKPRFGGVEF